MRGDVFRLPASRDGVGHEEAGTGLAIVVQSDHLPLSTWLVAPTSTSARPASFRPEIAVAGVVSRVLVEQATAVDPGRLGPLAGHLSADELRRVDAALRIALEL